MAVGAAEVLCAALETCDSAGEEASRGRRTGTRLLVSLHYVLLSNPGRKIGGYGSTRLSYHSLALERSMYNIIRKAERWLMAWSTAQTLKLLGAKRSEIWSQRPLRSTRVRVVLRQIYHASVFYVEEPSALVTFEGLLLRSRNSGVTTA